MHQHLLLKRLEDIELLLSVILKQINFYYYYYYYNNTTTTEKTEITTSVQQSTLILSAAVALSLIVCIVIVVVFKMRGKSRYLYSDNTFILYTDDKQHFP